MHNEFVSVIIPAFNSGQYIVETINSVLNQTYTQIEIIVVDDGSTDNTLEIVSCLQNPALTLITQRNKGACAARNLGYRHATGNYIQFLDADDLLAPDKIERQMKQLLSYPDHKRKVTHCQWGRFYKSIEEHIRWEPHTDIQSNLSPILWLISNRMSMTGCWLTPRTLIDARGLWDESLKRNQDGEFFSRLISYADEVLYCPEAKVYYRSGLSSSVSSNTSKPAAASDLDAIHLIREYTLKLEDSDRSRVSLANKYLEFAYGHYLLFPDLASLAEAKAAELGGGSLNLPGGLALRSLDTALGWKNALKIKNACNNLFNRNKMVR